MMIDKIIAKISLIIIKHELERESVDSSRPCIRVKDLQPEEIVAFLGYLNEDSCFSSLNTLQTIIARGNHEAFPAQFVAEPDKSITYYRNNNQNGLIYIQTKIESDEQGLESMFTIRDRNYLDGSLDDERFNVKREVILAAWDCFEINKKIPNQFVEMVCQVIEMLHPSIFSVSIRSFCRFAYHACKVLSQIDGPVEKNHMEKIIGKSLVELGLMPDELWQGNNSNAMCQRRLANNHYYSELTNSKGIEFDPEELADEALNKTFKDLSNNVFVEEEQNKWQTLCRAYCLHRLRDQREKIPFYIFEQLFTKDVVGVPLGERIEREIGENNPERLQEYLSLDVKDGISRKISDDAQKFLDKEPDSEEDSDALCDIISKTTLKMVKRVAYPRNIPFSNPFIQLVEIVREFDSTIQNDDRSDYVIELLLGKRVDSKDASLGLFSFLYGNTLKSILDVSKDDVSGLQINIDADLIAFYPLPELRDLDDEESEDEVTPVEWEDLPIEFRLINKKTDEICDSLVNYVWRPEDIDWLSLLWIIIAEKATNFHSLPDGMEIDEWVKSTSSRLIPIPDSPDMAIVESSNNCTIVKSLLELRNECFHDLSQAGICVDLINEYVTNWSELQRRAKDELIPNGSFDSNLASFLSMDVIPYDNDNKAMMLATHPFRLNWIAKYFEYLRILCIDALSQELVLNTENDTLYLSKLSNLSPHKYPPVLVTKSKDIMIPTSELGWNEHFSPVKDEEKSSSILTETIDDASVKEIAKQVESYIESHPYKKDGISILTLLPSGGVFPVQLLSCLRKSAKKNLNVTFHVVTPKNNWHNISSKFERIESENRMALGGKLFPPLQLKFYEWGEIDTYNIICDLSIIPNFFGNKVEIYERTIEDYSRPGKHEVPFVETSYVDKGNSSGTVSIVLLPYDPDNTLNDWSTLNVRLRRCHLIAANQPQNIDYFEMAVMFSDAAKLFEQLHEYSHWVITYDQYIGRSQIENLEHKPDVLTVKERVGRNGLYTLVVSSNFGKKFIVSRLSRKLQAIGGRFKDLVDNNVAVLADRIYDEIREVAPSLVLRAMGLSRITEEILGLIVAKRIAEKHYTSRNRNNITIWFSLDDYSDWFANTRADLCRFTFYYDQSNILKLEALIVEGKMRKQYDSHGVTQVLKTMELFESILNTDNNNIPSKDAKVWRKEILSALENTSEYAKQERLNGSTNSISSIPDDIRSDFKEGSFEVERINGLFSMYNYCIDEEQILLEEDGVLIVKSYSDEVLKLLGNNITGDHQNEISVNDDNTEIVEDDGVEVISPQPPSDEKDINTEISKTLSVEKLDEKYQIIIDTLSEFKVKAHLPSGNLERYIEGPASILFRVKPGEGVKPNKITEQRDALKLKLNLPEDASISFSIDKGHVNIDVPKDAEERYFVFANKMWSIWAVPDETHLSVPLGEDRFGNIIDIDFSSSNSPHLLIGGTTGSGKSEALNTILKGMEYYYNSNDLKLLLIDPKGTELVDFESSPFLKGSIGWDAEDAIAVLEEAVNEMQNRYQMFKAAKKRSLPEYNSCVEESSKVPWWVLVLDEYADLTSDPDEKREVERLLKRIAQKGRACGIHVIIATQKPSADVISTTLRSNLPAQMALRVRSAIESKVIMDEAGAESLNGKGDAIFRANGKTTRIQTAIVN